MKNLYPDQRDKYDEVYHRRKIAELTERMSSVIGCEITLRGEVWRISSPIHVSVETVVTTYSLDVREVLLRWLTRNDSESLKEFEIALERLEPEAQEDVSFVDYLRAGGLSTLPQDQQKRWKSWLNQKGRNKSTPVVRVTGRRENSAFEHAMSDSTLGEILSTTPEEKTTDGMLCSEMETHGISPKLNGRDESTGLQRSKNP